MKLFTKMKQSPTAKKLQQKDNKGRWKKGQAGNPAAVWKKGQSGNPKGSSKKARSFTDTLRSHIDMDELSKKLIELVEEGNLQAIIYVGNRLDGSPKQSIEAKVEGDFNINFVSDFQGV